MKLRVSLLILFMVPIASATVDTVPPLTENTLKGTWEALIELHPSPTLLHMRISEKEDSYLAQLDIGTSPVVRRLVSSEIKNDTVTLHFGKATVKDLPNVVFGDIWIVGTGGASMGPASKGMIIGRWCICGGPMPISAAPNIYFFKGNWTKEVAGASEKADRAIDEAIASRKSKSP